MSEKSGRLFSHTEFYFQQGLAEATHSCTVQSAEFLALWFVIKLREKGSGV